MGGSAAWRERELWVIPRRAAGSAQPAGRDACAARLFFEVCEGLLVVDDGFLQLLELGERLVAILLDDAALRGVGAVDEIGGERVDLRLERPGERLIAIERVLKGLLPR